MKRVLFLGAPGSGKSTQGQMLAEKLGWKWISTGELLRSSDEAWVKEKLKTAELFPDEMIFELLTEALAGVDGAILDGAVRTKAQALYVLSPEIGLDTVVEISVPREELLKRVLQRGRDQDTEEIARQRLEDYDKMKGEILEVLRQGGVKILEVDGVGTPEEVQARLREVLKEEQ